MKKKASDKLYQMGIKGEYFCTKTLNGFESYFNGPFVFFSVQAVKLMKINKSDIYLNIKIF